MDHQGNRDSLLLPWIQRNTHHGTYTLMSRRQITMIEHATPIAIVDVETRQKTAVQSSSSDTLNVNSQPTYLRQLLQVFEPVRSFRSSYTNWICKSAVRTVRVLASRGFRHSAVFVWNNLPDNVRDAKTCDIFKR